jgi:hypothetical protein
MVLSDPFPDIQRLEEVVSLANQISRFFTANFPTKHPILFAIESWE